MINNARKSAAISSTYGYIEAVEMYQGMQDINEQENFEEGQYNISTSTTINDKTYNPINSYIKMKGKKATGGKIHITASGKVDTATICIDDYLIDYQNNEASIVSNDCGDIDLTILFGTNSSEWETSKVLTITYPNKNYEKYYKLESGKASINGEQVQIGQEIKVENNEIKITLEENSKVTAWLVKNNKKSSETSYEEKKIDNVELGTPTASITDSYPTLKLTGIERLRALTITYDNQEGTSAYYSLDNGSTWNKYLTNIYIDNNVTPKVKLVRDLSKREGDIVTATVSSTSLTPLSTKLYDDDESTYEGDGTWYVNVDPNMIGKSVSYKASPYQCDSWVRENFTFINSSNQEFDSFNINGCQDSSTKTLTEEAFTIPAGTVRIKIYFNNVNFYELTSSYYYSLKNNTTGFILNNSKTFTNSGIVENNKKKLYLKHNSNNVDNFKFYYSKNDSSFVEYNAPFLIENNDVVKTKIVDKLNDNSVIKTITTNASSGDSLPSTLYDNNESTCVGDGTWYVDIDSNMIGKGVAYKASPYQCDSYVMQYFTFINLYGKEISSFKIDGCQDSSTKTLSEEAFTIPAGTVRIKIQFNNTNFCELRQYSNN